MNLKDTYSWFSHITPFNLLDDGEIEKQQLFKNAFFAFAVYLNDTVGHKKQNHYLQYQKDTASFWICWFIVPKISVKKCCFTENCIVNIANHVGIQIVWLLFGTVALQT